MDKIFNNHKTSMLPTIGALELLRLRLRKPVGMALPFQAGRMTSMNRAV